MSRFCFGPWSCSKQEAMAILKCSKRTIENYYNPKKRDPVKWHYLELVVTNRILPDRFVWVNNKLGTDTGYEYTGAELTQWAFFQSTKNAQIAQYQEKITILETRLKSLEQQKPATVPINNVVHFRPRKTLAKES